jgi:hypothetical protein
MIIIVMILLEFNFHYHRVLINIEFEIHKIWNKIKKSAVRPKQTKSIFEDLRFFEYFSIFVHFHSKCASIKTANVWQYCRFPQRGKARAVINIMIFFFYSSIDKIGFLFLHVFSVLSLAGRPLNRH